MFPILAVVVLISGCVNSILINNARNVEEIANSNPRCVVLIDNEIKIGKIENVLEKRGLYCNTILKFNTTAIQDENDLVLKKEKDGNNILLGMIDAIKILSNNGSVLLITDKDVVTDGQLFSMVLQEIWSKNIKLFVVWKSKIDNESILNLKKIALATEGSFINFYDSQQETTYEKVIQNESVLGHYKQTFYVSGSTKYVFIRIIGSIKNVERAEIVKQSGEKLNLLDQSGFVILGNVYFKALKVQEGGPWTITVDAKKRVFISVIIENAHPSQNQAQFSRFVATQKVMDILPAISIDVGANSELLSVPNKYIKVYFEVTNNQDQPLQATFKCTDMKFLSQHIDPTVKTIAPNETVLVTVSLQTLIASGSTTTLTFSVSGTAKAEKMAHLSVNNETPTDLESPNLWYTLISDCANVAESECDTATWSADISAQDKETGLLQLKSEPRGIYFTSNDFISGSKEEVIGHYVGSCCKLNSIITAVDLIGNKKILEVNAYSDTTLSAGSISGIIIGVILLIIVVVVIIYFVVRQKQKGSMDLPTYRGPSSSRTAL